jgi:hypothetical protein
VSDVHDGRDDDQLLEALGAAINARRAVPAKFVQTAMATYTWHDIDAELELLSRSVPGAG